MLPAAAVLAGAVALTAGTGTAFAQETAEATAIDTA